MQWKYRCKCKCARVCSVACMQRTLQQTHLTISQVRFQLWLTRTALFVDSILCTGHSSVEKSDYFHNMPRLIFNASVWLLRRNIYRYVFLWTNLMRFEDNSIKDENSLFDFVRRMHVNISSCKPQESLSAWWINISRVPRLIRIECDHRCRNSRMCSFFWSFTAHLS